MAKIEVPDEAVQQIVGYIVATPKVLGGLFCSYFSGQLWAFLTVAYFKKNTRGNKMLDSLPAKVALGSCWFCLISLPIYWAKYDSMDLVYDNFLNILPAAIIVAFALQLFVYLAVAKWGASQ